MINSASHAFCNQPAIGGPVYWIRNIAYHLPGGSTRLTSGSAGVLFYNNTILSETAGAGRVERPLAQQPVSRRELGAGDLQRSTPSPTTPRRTTTASGRIPARRTRSQWNSPPWATAADYSGIAARTRRRARAARRRSRRVSSRRSPSTAAATRSGSAQRARRLRRVRERAEARRAGRRDGAEGLQGRGSSTSG